MNLLIGQAIQVAIQNDFTQYEEKINGEVGGISSILFPLLSFIFVLLIAYLVTKFVALKATQQHTRRNFNVIDQFHLDKHTKLTIVKIAGEVYILGITENNIQVIDTLGEGRINEVMQQEPNNMNFNVYLQDKLGQKKYGWYGKLLKKMYSFLSFTLSKSTKTLKLSNYKQKNSKDEKNDME